MTRRRWLLLWAGVLGWGSVDRLGLPGFGAWAASVGDAKERLRRLVRLPRLSYMFALSFGPAAAFKGLPDPATARRELGEVRQALQGNPGDADRQLRIAELQAALGNEAEAQRGFHRAIELYRRQGAETGEDGRLLAGYGKALVATAHHEEAERVLRRAVRVAPDEWRGHAVLGRCLGEQAMRGAFGGVAPDKAAAAKDGSGEERERGVRRPEAGALDQARQQAEEALASYERAIGVNADAAEAYSGRAATRAVLGLIAFRKEPGSSDEPEALRMGRAIHSAASLADLERVSELMPRSAQALGIALGYRLIVAALERGRFASDLTQLEGLWTVLPEAAREAVRRGLSRLEQLGQSPEDAVAAAALEWQGVLQAFVLEDQRGGEASLRQAASRDPSRNQAWEALVFLLATSRRHAELVELAATRLHHDDSPRNRLLLVKGLDGTGAADRMLREAEELRSRYPEDFNANLALAAVLLRRGGDEVLITQATSLLSKAEKLLTKPAQAEDVLNLFFLRGMCLALADQRESAMAHLKAVLEVDRDYTEAREALEILEPGGA